MDSQYNGYNKYLFWMARVTSLFLHISQPLPRTDFVVSFHEDDIFAFLSMISYQYSSSTRNKHRVWSWMFDSEDRSQVLNMPVTGSRCPCCSLVQVECCMYIVRTGTPIEVTHASTEYTKKRSFSNYFFPVICIFQPLFLT